MQFFGSTQNLKQILKESPVFNNICFIDEDVDLPHNVSPHQCILVTNKNLEPQDVVSLVSKKGIKHVIQGNHFDLKNEIIMAAKFINNHADLKNLDINNIFGFKKINFSQKVLYSKEKSTLRKNIDEFINNNTELLKPLSESIWTIADELFMNSFYDAPTDSKGNYLYAHLPRTSTVQLDKDKPVEIFICFDKENVVVGSIDCFGSFNENKFIKQFNSSYTNENSNINMGKGGAGIGCKIMFEQSISTYFYSVKNNKTLVCCKIPTYQSKHRKDLLYKNLHLSIK